MQAIISVDPGVFTFGACLWDLSYWCNTLAQPVETVCLDVPARQRKKSNKSTVMYNSTALIEPWLNQYDVQEMWVEKPYVSHNKSAAKQVQYMEFQRGILQGLCFKHNVIFNDAPVQQWKGQLPKELVNNRILDMYTSAGMLLEQMLSKRQSHDWDALGIGLWAQGFFK